MSNSSEININEEFFKHKQLKSFIRVGKTFIDIKQTIGFSFMKNEDSPNGYLIAQFVYESGRAMNAYISNRNELMQFLVELDVFIDDPAAMTSMSDFADELERDFDVNNKNKKKYYKNKKWDKS